MTATNDPKPPTERTVQQLFDLTGRTALVTGGAGWLGAAMCRALAEAGARVVVGGRDAERSAAFAQTLPSHGGAVHLGAAIDHMHPNHLKRRFDEILSRVGSIEVVINNAHEPVGADWRTISPDEFSRQLANATGYFELSRLAHDHAVARGDALSVVLVGSMYGVVGSYPDAYEGICIASPAAYQALKGGVVQLARHLAVYWAKDRVRVNCLSPGPFPGPQAPASLVERLKIKSPMGRMGSPDELKGAVVFLASDASSYVTGQNLLVDGGWTAW